MSIQELITLKDYNGIEKALAADPGLANIKLPYDENNGQKAHVLHRMADGVFAKLFTDEEAVVMAKIFLKNGAKVNGNQLVHKQDSPLTAAASLHADKVALLYIEAGADIHHGGCYGGTALHWAAWCGREAIVKKLLEKGAETNRLCIEFKATPLFWAVHGIMNGGKKEGSDHLACIKLLMAAGADQRIPNTEGYTVYDLIGDRHEDVRAALG
jgi:uncharacterized protein